MPSATRDDFVAMIARMHWDGEEREGDEPAVIDPDDYHETMIELIERARELDAVRPCSDDLTVALHRLARAREVGARNPHHYQNVGLQYKHIVALLAALGDPTPTPE